MKEIWKKIKGFPKYEINEKGVVRSWFLNEKGNIDRKRPFRIMTHNQSPNRYITVGLSPTPTNLKTMPVHKLLCLAFKGKPKKGEVILFKDFDKGNIDLDNLEYGTRKGRPMSPRRKLAFEGDNCHSSKLESTDIPVIRRLIAENISMALIGRAYHVSDITIGRVNSGQTWGYIE